MSFKITFQKRGDSLCVIVINKNKGKGSFITRAYLFFNYFLIDVFFDVRLQIYNQFSAVT